MHVFQRSDTIVTGSIHSTKTFFSDPNLIASNIVLQSTSPNTNDAHSVGQGDLSSGDQNVPSISDRQSNQINQESNASNSGVQTVYLPGNYNVYPSYNYSPPPPYDLCLVSNAFVQPAQQVMPQQIVHFPQYQNVQYLQQQRLQYPQQESLQYHEEISDYLQHQRMLYPNDRYLPPVYEPPVKANNCNNCLMDAICCCVCVLPIALFLLYVAGNIGS